MAVAIGDVYNRGEHDVFVTNISEKGFLFQAQPAAQFLEAARDDLTKSRPASWPTLAGRGARSLAT